jgi:hypothetical protein
MVEKLEKHAKKDGIVLVISQANCANDARNALASRHFHLVSLDMRLPQRVGELITVSTGIALATEFPYLGFPKRLIYSQTLNQERNPESQQVMQLKADLYAKASGSDKDVSSDKYEVLSRTDWVNRVLASLDLEEVRIAESTLIPQPLTMIGTYLEQGPHFMPLSLAEPLQLLHDTWLVDDSARSNNIRQFIKQTIALAVLQTAMLLSLSISIPDDCETAACLAWLAIRRDDERFEQWNWASYLTAKTITELQHWSTLPVPDWQSSRLALQYALDVAAYWVQHPLIGDLLETRDGWSGRILSTTQSGESRSLLPKAITFPSQAEQYGSWQSVWDLSNKSRPERHAISWPEPWVAKFKSSQD